MNGHEDDLTGAAKDYAHPACLVGTVGWDGREEHAELGTDDNDGHTLVCVTLYEGKTPGVETKVGVAQGYQIRCHISALTGIRVPPKGTRVYVLFPHGMTQVPGAGVIVATIEKTASRDQFTTDRVVIDYGADTHLVIKGKSVSLSDHANRFMTVGSPRSGGAAGLTFQAEDGSGGVIQTGVVSWFVAAGGEAQTILQMTTSKVECMCKGGGMWKVDASGYYCLGTSATVAGGAVYLGAVPTVVTGACYGPNIAAGLTSTSVFISP